MASRRPLSFRAVPVPGRTARRPPRAWLTASWILLAGLTASGLLGKPESGGYAWPVLVAIGCGVACTFGAVGGLHVRARHRAGLSAPSLPISVGLLAITAIAGGLAVDEPAVSAGITALLVLVMYRGARRRRERRSP